MIASPQPVRALPRWVTLVVLGVAALAFLPTLGGGFLGDDFVYVARFREFPWRGWPGLFTHEWSGGIWGMQLHELRPFAALSFMGDARLFGGDALGYRLTNLGLHLVSTLVVLRLAWRYSAGRIAAALLAGLVFALHPAHAEAVSWITGRVDLQATAAALLYWLAAEVFSAYGRRGHFILLLLSFFVGIFSKELCMFTPILLVLRWALLDPRAGGAVWRRRALALGGTLVVFAFYAWCRHRAFEHDAIGYNLWTDGPAWQRQASYVGWLLPVLPFAARMEFQSLPPLTTLHGLWLVFAGVALGGFALACWRRWPLAAAAFFFGGLWYLVSVFPLTGVTYFSPRHLYFPTIGVALGMGLACGGSRAGRVLGAAFVLWCAAAHFAALKPWRTAGAISAGALAAVDRELATAPAGTIAVTAVPETVGPAWLWPWTTPASFRPPFLAHPPAAVVERAGNYSRVDFWAAEKKPIDTVTAAPGAVALFVDEQNRIFTRRVEREELQRRAADLAKTGGNDRISVEYWTDWVKSLARPEPPAPAKP